MPVYDATEPFGEVTDRYNTLFALRDDVMKALEIARADKKIGKSLDAKVTVYCGGEAAEILRGFGDELKTVFIVSGVSLADGEPAEGAFVECVSEGIAGVLVEQADGVRCDRCWMYTTDGGETADGGHLCDRCRAAIK